MENIIITQYFEDVETTREYKGYFCSIAETITIKILGSICRLRNISQIHQWAKSDRVSGFLKEKFGIENMPCYYWLLCLLKLGKTRIAQQLFYSLGSEHPAPICVQLTKSEFYVKLRAGRKMSLVKSQNYYLLDGKRLQRKQLHSHEAQKLKTQKNY